jgi:hypothetical protein
MENCDNTICERSGVLKLKDNGLIEYVGSDKTGGYRIVTKG